MPQRIDTVRGTLVGFFTHYGLDVLGAIAIAIIGWLASRSASRLIRSLPSRTERIDDTLAPVLAKAARFVVLAMTLVAVLEKFGVDTSSVLAVFGAAGIGVGLALKDTLADVAAGIVLLVLRPFDVGDEVDVDATGGVVTSIGVFQTALTSADGVPIVLPNAKIRIAKVQNYTRAERRRVELAVSVPRAADVAPLLEALRAAAADDPRVLTEPPASAHLAELRDDSLGLIVRAWTRPEDHADVKLALTRRVRERLPSVEA
jgi:small conductance mechanosensitive channel